MNYWAPYVLEQGASKDPRRAAQKLCMAAKHKRLYNGMSPDDISCIVIDLGTSGGGSGSDSSLLG